MMTEGVHTNLTAVVYWIWLKNQKNYCHCIYSSQISNIVKKFNSKNDLWYVHIDIKSIGVCSKWKITVYSRQKVENETYLT